MNLNDVKTHGWEDGGVRITSSLLQDSELKLMVVNFLNCMRINRFHHVQFSETNLLYFPEWGQPAMNTILKLQIWEAWE